MVEIPAEEILAEEGKSGNIQLHVQGDDEQITEMGHRVK